MINNNRRNQIRTLINEIYYRFNIESFPINLFDITSQVPPIKVHSYQEEAKRLNKRGVDVDVAFIADNIAQSDEATSKYDAEKKEYLLLYNSNTREKIVERIGFSIAHELGHIFLKHHLAKYSSDKLVKTDNLIEILDSTAEEEANFFASELLMPMAKLNFFADGNLHLNINNAYDHGLAIDFIKNIFEVSTPSATNMLSRFVKIKDYIKPNRVESKKYYQYVYTLPTTDKRINYSRLLPKYGRLSSGFMYSTQIHFHFCHECHALTSSYLSDFHFCPVCGSKNLTHATDTDFYKFHEKEEQEMIEYSQFNVINTPSHIQPGNPCPRCGCEITDLEVNFCDVCGFYLINRCTGLSNANFKAEEGYTNALIYGENGMLRTLKSNDFTFGFQGCSIAQSGKARFCSKCGCATTFSLQRVFEAWQDEKKEIEIAPTNVSESDLPF